MNSPSTVIINALIGETKSSCRYFQLLDGIIHRYANTRAYWCDVIRILSSTVPSANRDRLINGWIRAVVQKCVLDSATRNRVIVELCRLMSGEPTADLRWVIKTYYSTISIHTTRTVLTLGDVYSITTINYGIGGRRWSDWYHLPGILREFRYISTYICSTARAEILYTKNVFDIYAGVFIYVLVFWLRSSNKCRRYMRNFMLYAATHIDIKHLNDHIAEIINAFIHAHNVDNEAKKILRILITRQLNIFKTIAGANLYDLMWKNDTTRDLVKVFDN